MIAEVFKVFLVVGDVVHVLEHLHVPICAYQGCVEVTFDVVGWMVPHYYRWRPDGGGHILGATYRRLGWWRPEGSCFGPVVLLVIFTYPGHPLFNRQIRGLGEAFRLGAAF